MLPDSLTAVFLTIPDDTYDNAGFYDEVQAVGKNDRPNAVADAVGQPGHAGHGKVAPGRDRYIAGILPGINDVSLWQFK